MANPNRDTSKRWRSQALPIELAVKLEQAVGVKPGEKPTYVQRILMSDMIVKAVERMVGDVELDPVNKAAVEEEIRSNEERRAQAQKDKPTTP